MLRGEPKGQASPVPTGRPSSPLSSLSEDQDPGAVEPRAQPRGPTAPRRPSSALGQRGPLGPAPLRFGLPTARGGQAGLRGRSLIGASCTQGSWEGATTARAHGHDARQPGRRVSRTSGSSSPRSELWGSPATPANPSGSRCGVAAVAQPEPCMAGRSSPAQSHARRARGLSDGVRLPAMQGPDRPQLRS